MKKIITTCLGISLITISGYSQISTLKKGNYEVTPCTTPIGTVMFAPVDTTDRRGVADNYKMWPNASVLKVKFMYGVGSQSMRTKIMQYAKEWEQYANLTLNFVNDDAAETDIRILLGSKFDSIGHNSYVGLDCRNEKYKFQQTMNLDTSDFFNYDYYVDNFKSKGAFYQYVISIGRNLNTYTYSQLHADVINYPAEKIYVEKIIRRKSQHEMGHALGLLHEQSYPGAIRWNRDTIYKYYSGVKWTKEMVDFNVLLTSDQFFTNGTIYDPLSIMHYPVYSWQTLNGFSVDASTQISEGDKKLMAALYPKNKRISDLEVPKVIVSNFTSLAVTNDAKRKAVVIRPAFAVSTGSLLANAYYVARLVTEDGKRYIPTNNSFYSWNGMAATYLKVNLLSNSNIRYNKDMLYKLELLFPYNQMPDLNGKKFKVEFSVYQNDAATGQMSKMVMYSYSGLLSMSR